MADQIRVKGGVLLGALVSGALAAGTLTGAPAANATCASFFGINNGGGCTSTLTTIAIAIGTGATAHADGLFGAAFAIGTNSSAFTGNSPLAVPPASLGLPAFGNIAIAVGTADTPGKYQAGAGGIGNVAVSLFGRQTGAGAENNTFAVGVLNLATNLGGSAVSDVHLVQSWGYLNNAINIGGNNNTILAGRTPPNLAIGSVAFNVFGSGNKVLAYPGPLAVAGAFNQNAVTVTQASPGINLYTRLALGAASVSHATKTSAPTATAVRNTNQTAAPAAAAHSPTQKPAPAATATSRGKR